MHVILEFTVIPMGVGVSLSPYVAVVQRVLQASGLHHRMHANGTNVEGEWEAVMAALRACHDALHAAGVPRVFTDVKLSTRTDRDQRMDQKVASVEARLAGGPDQSTPRKI